MKKRFSVILLVISMMLGLGTLSFSQVPDVSGDWLFDLSGVTQGGALITIAPDGNFEGYGVGIQSGGQEGNEVQLSGLLTVDEKGKITGTYVITDAEDGVTILDEGNLTGKVDKKITKLAFKFEDGFNGKAIKLPDDPVMPQFWTVSANGGKASLNLDITPNLQFAHRVYDMAGSGYTKEDLPISIDGGFFLNSKSKAYGWYEVYDITNDLEPILLEEGLFFGKVKLTSGKSSLSLKLSGYDPDDGSMSKGVLKGTAN